MSDKVDVESMQVHLKELHQLLDDFDQSLGNGTVREHVQALVPINHKLRALGKSTVDPLLTIGARDRILKYLRAHPGVVIHGDELMVVSGISEYARRVRELRVEFGWPILSGKTAGDLRAAEAEVSAASDDAELTPTMSPDQYMLLEDREDRDAAHRWRSANVIRKKNIGVKAKLLEFFKANVGIAITSEELRYLAGDKSEWARRTRELRTEGGWPITTRFNGNPKLPTGVYVLAEDRQAPTHDRHIKEIVRREVMKRDAYSCRWVECGWDKSKYDVDPRFLEVHHIEHHVKGGKNSAENLVTLCNLHHDEVHRSGDLDIEPVK